MSSDADGSISNCAWSLVTDGVSATDAPALVTLSRAPACAAELRANTSTATGQCVSVLTGHIDAVLGVCVLQHGGDDAEKQRGGVPVRGDEAANSSKGN